MLIFKFESVWMKIDGDDDIQSYIYGFERDYNENITNYYAGNKWNFTYCDKAGNSEKSARIELKMKNHLWRTTYVWRPNYRIPQK